MYKSVTQEKPNSSNVACSIKMILTPEIQTILTGFPEKSGVFTLDFSHSFLTFAAKLTVKQKTFKRNVVH
jgi:hypothetical protein